MAQDIDIKKWGEKLLCNSISRNKIPAEYLSVSKNARVVDKCVTKRLGTKTKATWGDITGAIQWITYNNQPLVVMGGKLYKIDETTRVKTDLWSIGSTDKVNMLTYGKYTLIFTGIWYPRVYDGVTLTQTTIANCPNVNPIISEKFQWFTFITGNTADTDNILYISRPITPTNPEYAYDWVGANSEQITYDSKILGLVSSMNRLIIFTETRIEYIGKDSLQTIWWTATLVSTPIGNWWQLASWASVMAGGDTVMYLTKNNTINTLFYAQWTVEPIIWDLTDDVSFTITQYLKRLDTDQSNSFWYYDDTRKEFHWFLREINVPYNNTVLIYDIGNSTRTTDTKKFFNDVVVAGNKVYAWSAINCSIKEVNVWYNDDEAPIEFEIEDTDVMLGTLREKMFQWRQTSWGVNKYTKLEFTTIIDDSNASKTTVNGADYFSNEELMSYSWIWDTEIWGDAIWWLTEWNNWEIRQFDKTLDHWYIYKRGTRIRRNIIENQLNSYFYLDYYVLFADTTGNLELNDKR